MLEAEGVSADDIFMYGHSLGARLVIDAAIPFGVAQIDGEKSQFTSLLNK